MVGAKAARPDDRADGAAGELQGEGRRFVDPGRGEAVRDSTSSARPFSVANWSMTSSRRPSLRSESAHWFASEPENCSRPTSRTPLSASALKSRVRRSGEPMSWSEGTLRALDVVDLVVALVEHAAASIHHWMSRPR
jgi:hypothetical protein